MVKAGEVGEKGRAFCSCFWTLLGMKKEAQFQPLDRWKSKDSGKAANRPLLDRSEAR